jgi:genome maintenance exonuclease 1
MLMQIKPFEDVKLIEGAVFHPKLRYAGKLDGIVNWNGRWCVVDWKTANTPQTEGWMYRQKIQVAAYVAAANKTYGSDKAYRNLKLEHGLIVVALPNCEAQVFMMNWEQLENFFRQWLKRLRMFQSLPSKF